mmetsp:Transcript_87758/g.139368  ORF Transcript_87758/g.139368 Transcript_87758/m.139368 type:complete len:218 (-) Transcript_87758:280-933(-)
MEPLLQGGRADGWRRQRRGHPQLGRDVLGELSLFLLKEVPAMCRQPIQHAVCGLSVLEHQLRQGFGCFLSDRVVRVIHQRQRQGGTLVKETLRCIGIDLQNLWKLQSAHQKIQGLLLHKQALRAEVCRQFLQEDIQGQRPKQLLHPFDEAIGLPNALVIDPSQRHRQQLPGKSVKVFLQTLGNQSHALGNFSQDWDVALAFEHPLHGGDQGCIVLRR